MTASQLGAQVKSSDSDLSKDLDLDCRRAGLTPQIAPAVAWFSTSRAEEVVVVSKLLSKIEFRMRVVQTTIATNFAKCRNEHKPFLSGYEAPLVSLSAAIPRMRRCGAEAIERPDSQLIKHVHLRCLVASCHYGHS